MTDELRVLTVRQPHAWAIVHGFKDVENRTWGFPLPLGSLLAVHAAVKLDPGGLHARPDVRVPESLTRGAIVGFARVVDDVADSPSVWAIPGQRHWLLDDAWSLPWPIPARGHLWLWRTDDDTATRLAAAINQRQGRMTR